MKHSPIILALVACLVAACKPTVPSQYIQPSDMEDILYDYHLSQAMAKYEEGSSQREYNQRLYFLLVLKKHQVSEADFDSSLVYYYSHVDRLKEIYVHVNERMADNAKNLGAVVGDINRYSQYSTSGDTANIWTGPADVLLIPRPTKNRFEFTVKADSTFHVGDQFMFQFMTEYIFQNGMKDAVVYLSMRYEGDSISSASTHVSMSGISQLRVAPNMTKKLKEMKGFVYLNDGGDDTDTRKLMFISQIQLIRFHNKALEAQYEREKNDSVKTDSMQRVGDTSGKVADSIRHRNIAGIRSQSTATSGRTAPN